MKPVILFFENVPIIGSFPVSSFGLSLLLAFLLSTFIIWRITRVYDIDSEQVIDQILLTIGGALIGARLYFVLLHLSLFDSVAKFFLINRYPGLLFWGAFSGGFFTLWYFNRKKKLNFWQIADYITPGLFLALSVTSIGCLLGSCQYGLITLPPFGITQIGIVGKRFPLQIIEAILNFSAFLFFWKSVLKFHIPSQIASKGLIILGLIKLFLEPVRGDSLIIIFGITSGYIWSLLLIIYGTMIYYKNVPNPQRTFTSDLKLLFKILTNNSKRHQVVTKFRKSCYNALVDLRIFSKRFRKNILKLMNIKSNPDKF